MYRARLHEVKKCYKSAKTQQHANCNVVVQKKINKKAL